jgi:MFS family permease
MKYRANKLRSVFLVGFLLTIALALTNYIDSSFLGTHIDLEKVGILFSLGSITSIVFLSLLPSLVNRIAVRGVFHLSGLMYLISVLGMIYVNNTIIFSIFFVFYITSGYALYFTLDMLIERISKNKMAGVVRGIYLTIYNLAYLIGPLLAGFILKSNSFNLIYLVSGIFIILMFLIFVRELEDVTFPKAYRTSFIDLFKRLIQSKNLINVYIVSLMLSFFFSWMSIYMPIYLKIFIGFDWQQIGIIFAIIHIPYITLEFPLGRLADKYTHEKKLMIVGLVILSLSTVILGFLNIRDFWIWTMVLFITRIGASFIQVGSESYFFKKVDARDSYMIAMFRNASPLAYALGPIVGTIFLAFTDYNNLIPILGIIMMSVAFFSLRLKRISKHE